MVPLFTTHRLGAASVVAALAVAAAAAEPTGAEQPTATLAAASVVRAGAITEASGLAASRTNPGVLWLVNDSGGEARVFALGIDGSLRCSLDLAGASAEDFEDIAVGPGADGKGFSLFIADIGDNLGHRPSVTVHVVAEPTLGEACAGGGPGPSLDGAHAVELTYPDGPRDAQALMVDPTTGDVWIASRNPAGAGGLYRVPPACMAEPTAELERVASIAVPGSGASDLAVTAGDIRSDGALVVLRTYTAAWAWQRAPGQPIAAAVAAEPLRLPVVGPPDEPQGEALALTVDGASYFTVGEGVAQSLYRFDFER